MAFDTIYSDMCKYRVMSNYGSLARMSPARQFTKKMLTRIRRLRDKDIVQEELKMYLDGVDLEEEEFLDYYYDCMYDCDLASYDDKLAEDWWRPAPLYDDLDYDYDY